MRHFAESAATMDRALALAPRDADMRVYRAWLDLQWRADPKPLRAILETLFNGSPAAAAKTLVNLGLISFCVNVIQPRLVALWQPTRGDLTGKGSFSLAL